MIFRGLQEIQRLKISDRSGMVFLSKHVVLHFAQYLDTFWVALAPRRVRRRMANRNEIIISK